MASGSPVKKKELWHRQPCDDEISWGHFQAYRDQPKPRKLQPVRCAVRGGVAPPLEDLLRWYRENGWRERVAAYDEHVDVIMLDERTAVLADRERAGAEAVADILEDARAVLVSEIRKLLAQSQATSFSAMKPNELARLLDTTVKLERLTKGQSTENHHHDLSALSVEELRALEALQRKAEGK
jgi:hypothetical protein